MNSEWRPDAWLRVAVWGSDGAGKSSLLSQYLYGTFSDEYRSTIGAELCVKLVAFGHRRIKYMIWDNSGNNRFHSMLPCFLRGFWIFMLVYSVADRRTFEAVPTYLDEIRQLPKHGQEALILLVGNKVDLDEEQPRVISTEEGKAFQMQTDSCLSKHQHGMEPMSS